MAHSCFKRGLTVPLDAVVTLAQYLGLRFREADPERVQRHKH